MLTMTPEEALSLSIEKQDVAGALNALQAGANPNAAFIDDDWTHLHQAAARNDADLVRALLQHGATVAATLDEDGSTVLHAAAEDGLLTIVQLLIETGDGRDWLNRFDYLERTPLACAAFKNHADVVDYLIAAGSDVNANNEERIGETALARAIEQRASLSIVESLLNAGADPRIEGWMGTSAIYSARKRASRCDATDDDVRVLALLEATVKHPR